MGRAMLLLVSGMFVIYGIVFKSINDRNVELPGRSIDYIEEEQGRNVTSSLIDMAIKSIDKNRDSGYDWSKDWGGSYSYQNYMESDSAYVKGFDQAMTSNNDYPNNTNVQSTGGWDEHKVLLYSKSSFNGKDTYTEVLLQRDPFSKFSFFTNHNPDNIYFFTGDTVGGPTHSNNNIHIAGTPVFEGLVTSDEDWEGHPNYTNEPQFNGGSNFRSNEITLPNKGGAQIAQLIDKAKARALYFSNDITLDMRGESFPEEIILSEHTADGTVDYFIDKMTYNDGVIATSKDVFIKGTLSGRLTVYSGDDIEIMGDLYYKIDPQIEPSSTDMLGLIAVDLITVDEYAHTASGTQDITIQGALMSLEDDFEVENYSSGDPRGRINLLGGIVQHERGPVGTFSGGSLSSGYSKNYKYDTRLIKSAPPLFPRKNSYSIVYWRDRSEFVDNN